MMLCWTLDKVVYHIKIILYDRYDLALHMCVFLSEHECVSNEIHTWMEMLDETGEMTGESNFGSEQVNATFPTDCIIL